MTTLFPSRIGKREGASRGEEAAKYNFKKKSGALTPKESRGLAGRGVTSQPGSRRAAVSSPLYPDLG